MNTSLALRLALGKTRLAPGKTIKYGNTLYNKALQPDLQRVYAGAPYPTPTRPGKRGPTELQRGRAAAPGGRAGPQGWAYGPGAQAG